MKKRRRRKVISRSGLRLGRSAARRNEDIRRRRSALQSYGLAAEVDINDAIENLLSKSLSNDGPRLILKEFSMLPSTKVKLSDGGFEVMVRSVFGKGVSKYPGSTKVVDSIVRVTPESEGPVVQFAGGDL